VDKSLQATRCDRKIGIDLSLGDRVAGFISCIEREIPIDFASFFVLSKSKQPTRPKIHNLEEVHHLYTSTQQQHQPSSSLSSTATSS
jgi:hypothetical protein